MMIRWPSPSLPPTNSPMTAPITERVLATFRLLKRYGSAFGSLTLENSCQQQRRNGYFWDDLQHNDLRIDHVTDDARIDDDDRQKYPDRRGEQETDDHFVEGNPRVIEIERVTRNRRRRGKDEPRNMKNTSQELP